MYTAALLASAVVAQPASPGSAPNTAPHTAPNATPSAATNPSTATALPAPSVPPAVGSSGNPVYRCPGPPVLYTDAISAVDARERGCRTIEGAPITVVQPPRPRSGATAASVAAASSTLRPGEGRIDPAAQRQRDSDARRILEAELRREEDKLGQMKREYNNGEPERRGDERNFALYLDRVAQMRAAIQRSESDVVALRRELAKLATP